MHRFSPGVLPSRVMINVNELVLFNPIFLDAKMHIERHLSFKDQLDEKIIDGSKLPM